MRSAATPLALVTGGAGFIGSHTTEALLERGYRVRVLDDLSAGSAEDVPGDAELLVGDVADAGAADRAVSGADVVLHLAARRSVVQSLEDPLANDATNVHGTLVLLEAARRAGVGRFVLASSSSVYGGAAPLPTTEAAPTRPRSPYAVSKLAGEQYCRVYGELYGLDTVVLRYFNVYGPRQRPDVAYAAVIPLFIDAVLRGDRPVVHGDGLQSRDFTYVADVVAANLAALTAPADRCSGRTYNVSAGGRHSLLELLDALGEVLGEDPAPVFSETRAGDVRDSQADIAAARRDLGYEPTVDFHEGLRRTAAWRASLAAP